MRVTLVRHAEVEEKYFGCYNGHLDIGLSPKGYRDAKNLKTHFNSSDFDAIFCSDLVRAKETLKQFIDSDTVIYTPELREKSWGKHEGLNFDAIIAGGEVKYKEFEQWIEALDGEPFVAYTQRVKKFFFEYLPSLERENILIITHSGVIKSFISIAKEISLVEAFSISIPYASFVTYDKISYKNYKQR